MGVFTLVSGIVPMITGWHSDSEITREVFEGIPGPIVAAFYTVVPVLLVWGAFAFADRVKNWERGAPDRRRTTPKNVKRRLADFRAGVYMKTLLRDSAAGLMHSFIYFGFLGLLGVTTVLELDHQLPVDLKFLHGRTYMAYAFIGDLFGTVFMIGIVWAIARRYIQRPYRIRIKSKPEHALILGVFFVLGLSGFVAEGFRIADAGMPSFEKWSFIGYPIATLVDGMSTDSLELAHQLAGLLSAHGALLRQRHGGRGSGRCGGPVREHGRWSPFLKAGEVCRSHRCRRGTGSRSLGSPLAVQRSAGGDLAADHATG
jgi:nitrate reductase gamma subunit